MKKALLALLIFCFGSIQAGERPYKIYDCFNFLNVFDLLSIRLRELSDKVDYFVLVESAETFRGTLKPLHFEENKHRFAPYLDQIIHVIVYDRFEPGNPDPWAREAFQRNQILRGLKNCEPEDVVIINDADEIIRSESLDQMLDLLHSSRGKVVSCEGEFYRWFYNRKERYDWNGPAMTTYECAFTISPQRVRENRNAYNLVVKKGGWHFSNMGGKEAYLEKLRSFSHYEGDTPANRDADNIYNGVKELFDLVEIDETFPKYIRENVEYFKANGMIDDGTGYR